MKFLKFKHKGEIKYCPAEDVEKAMRTMHGYFITGLEIGDVKIIDVEKYEEVEHGLVQMLTDEEYDRLNA